jgi:signal transduction histidine kinase
VASLADTGPQRTLADLSRLVLDFRLVTLLIATVYLSVLGADVALSWVLIAVGLANLLPLLRWQQVAPSLLRHPTYLAVDLVVTLGLLVLTGVEGPLVYYTLGTAFLAGVLYSYRGAVVFSFLLAAGYLGVRGVAFPVDGAAFGEFETLIGTPSMYVLLALGAAAIRGLLLRQAETEAQLVRAQAEAAAGAERARLARELHDTLAKTVEGMALLASSLPVWVARDPERAVADARVLTEASQSAAVQARELLQDLRSDRLDVPLHELVHRSAEAWSQDAGIPVFVDAQPVTDLDPGRRYELLAILREALRNVRTHAAAQSVAVELREDERGLTLRVDDDGRGLDVELDVDRLAEGGHFGVLGMRERAERAGGTLSIGTARVGGTAVVVRLPAETPAFAVARRAS